jgi:hypothetical protein
VSSTAAHRASLACALIVLGLTLTGLTLPVVAMCGGLASNYTPIIAFELARSVTDLHAIFGNEAGACRSAVAARMDLTNWIDSLAFIPAYGAFLALFFVARRTAGERVARAGFVIVVAACLADYSENYALFQISSDPDSPRWLTQLMWSTETKWVGIGIAGALGAVLLWNWRRPFGWLAAPLCAVGTVASLVSVPAPAVVGPYLSNAIALGWLVFLAVDVRESFRRAPTRSAA